MIKTKLRYHYKLRHGYIWHEKKILIAMNELLPMTLSISSCQFFRFGSNRIQIAI